MRRKRIALQRLEAPVRVKIGGGGGAPKIILQRLIRGIAAPRAKTPVRVEIGAGGGAPKIALQRSAHAKQTKAK